MPKGRKPLPTIVKQLHGSFIKDPQKFNAFEPVAPVDPPKCPKRFTGLAREQWKFVTSKLDEMMLLSSADQNTIETYVRAYVDWRHCCDMIDEHGYMVEVATQYGAKLVTSPWVTQQKMHADLMFKLLAVLGFSPSARSQLHVDKQAKVAPVASRNRSA